MKVEVWLRETSQAIIHADAVNTYQKGGMYCITDKTLVWKYPMQTIFRIVETYKE